MKITQPSSLLKSQSESVRNLILDTGLPLNRAPEALGMSSSDFLQWWSSYGELCASKIQLKTVAQFLGVTEEQIMLGKYDAESLRTRIFVDPLALPEKYSHNQFSYIRTSAHIFKYLAISRGQHFADSIAYKLNVSPLFYQNLNNRISLNYFIDLLAILESQGFTQNEVDSLSGLLFLSWSESPLFMKFKQATNYYDCYLTLANNFKLFDDNFIYKSELDKNHYSMITFLPYEIHNHFEWQECKMNKLFRYRQLLLGWFPYLSGLPPVIPTVSHQVKPDGIHSVCTVTFPRSPLTLLSLT
ncbi:MAG: hypothetical protein JNL11_03880 [Bdellovibrionaceae bacterium]|nr:hypothetical protein [Pseudobdellovibrionaceae bacterium]